MNIKTIKGTYDILPTEIHKWQYLEQLFRTIAGVFHYEEIRTPAIETVEVFKRTSGQASDIVTKEMFAFETKGNDLIAVRPEGTAPVIRSYVEHKMFGNPEQPVKLFYTAPMFRYERPQKGRQRQFHQFGVEAIGSQNPSLDAEVIMLALSVIDSLGLEDYELRINSLGDKESRDAYRQALRTHFEPSLNDLCGDCKTRYETNPLRILDCKIDHEHPSMQNAPSILDYLNDNSKHYFDALCEQLNMLGINYTIDSSIVRGLDYYNHTVFEIISTNPLVGAQSTICGGGRYDGLTKMFDGPDMPGIGFGLGIERLLIALDAEAIEIDKDPELDVYVVAADDYSKKQALSIVTMLRMEGLKVDMDFVGRSFKAQFKSATRLDASFAIILGETELNEGKVNIKHLATQTQETVEIEKMMTFLNKYLGGHHHE